MSCGLEAFSTHDIDKLPQLPVLHLLNLSQCAETFLSRACSFEYLGSWEDSEGRKCGESSQILLYFIKCIRYELSIGAGANPSIVKALAG
jgi:hypothetical protein